jgi:hypothetical protein
MDIFESLENLQVSEACFEDIVGIIEEYISESKYSAADLAERARKVLSQRKEKYEKLKKDPKADFFDTVGAEDRYSRAKTLASLPKVKKSGISAKTLDKAAFNSARSRHNELSSKLDNFSDNDEVQNSPEFKRAYKATDMLRDYGERRFDTQFDIRRPYHDYKAI